MVNPTGYTALDMIGFTDKGTYSSSENYVKNDLVHYSGNIWRCLIDDTTGIAPTEGVNWTLFIGEPTNLVERIIAPVETDPATNAWTVGRQIIYNDNLYEVIVAITAGDALVTYEDDPTNANIKLADPVETQLLDLKGNLSNRNLLDNAWFTVNQRGQSSYSVTDNSLCVDRWWYQHFNGANATTQALTVLTNGVNITTDGTGNEAIRQRLDHNEPQKYIIGETYTFSAKVSGSGTFQVNIWNGSGWIVIIPSETLSDDNNRILSGTFIMPTYTNDIYVAVICGNTPNITIHALKLELGSISTLAMDTAPNYAEELLKCQRYFNAIRTSSGQNDWFAVGLAIGDAAEFVLNVPPMRTVPTVTYNNLYVADGRVTQKAITAVRTIHADSNNQRIHFPVNFDNSSPYSEGILPVGLWGAAGGNSYLYLSADL